MRDRLLSYINRRPCSLSGAPALVSFTFDDFARSALINGGPILRDAGVHATYYAAPCLMGATTEVGEIFGEEDLHAVVAGGHELGSHTSTHCSAHRVTPAEYRQEIADGDAALRRVVGAALSGHFSYPFGHVTASGKRVAGQVAASCRATCHGINGPVADLNFLLAHRLYSDTQPVPVIERLLAQAVRPGRWLIFYTHDVVDRPSPYGCTPVYFATVVKLAVASGARVLPVGAALAAVAHHSTS